MQVCTVLVSVLCIILPSILCLRRRFCGLYVMRGLSLADFLFPMLYFCYHHSIISLRVFFVFAEAYAAFVAKFRVVLVS